MSLNSWLKLSEETRKNIFEQISAKSGLPAYAVEKDWWVVQILRVVFQTEIKDYAVFKGGTSLSKAWGLIERFSEDIDIAVDRSFLGFSGDLTNAQIKRLRKKSYEYFFSTFTPELNKEILGFGFKGLNVHMRQVESSDQDPIIIEIHYPGILEGTGYINPRVLLEMGTRSLMEPYSSREISSLVNEYYKGEDFADEVVIIPSVDPERTFLEKLFLLHEEFQKHIGKIRVNRLSRHLYDIERLMSKGLDEKALKNLDLYRHIVDHRDKLNHLRGIDYSLHNPESLNPIPPEEIMQDWERDYNKMKEEMIYGDSLSFPDLIKRITDLKHKINLMKF